MSQVNIIHGAQSETTKEKKIECREVVGEGGGDAERWRRGLECLCDTQSEGETHGERKKKIERERSPCARFTS